MHNVKSDCNRFPEEEEEDWRLEEFVLSALWFHHGSGFWILTKSAAGGTMDQSNSPRTKRGFDARKGIRSVKIMHQFKFEAMN